MAESRRRPWTPEELALLRELYPNVTAAECARRLGRSVSSLAINARKI